jgi:gliding motility-associated-like protein
MSKFTFSLFSFSLFTIISSLFTKSTSKQNISMRKIYSLFCLLFFGVLSVADAQVIIKNGSIKTCGDVFYDSGGQSGSYSQRDNFTFTICSSDALRNHISLGFDQLDLHAGDELCFFDGDNTSAPSLGCASDFSLNQNAIIQSSITNRTGCITVRFIAKSQFFGNFNKGWAANIICIPNCQNIQAVLESTPVAVPRDTGWINACPAQTRINFKAKGKYPQNGYSYNQDDSLNNFEWNFGDGSAVAYGTDVTHVFDKSGGYNVKLTITDTLGCQNTNYIKQRVRISPKPSFNINNLPSQVCAGTEIKLKAKVNTVDPSSQVSVMSNAGSFDVGGVRSGRLFIPDDGLKEYRTSVRFSDFAPGQTLTNVNDLLSIFVNMEHSWARDLEIKLVCPSQKVAILHKYDYNSRDDNELFIGIPNENDAAAPFVNDSSRNTPGTGLKYEWVASGATKTWRNYFLGLGKKSIPAGKYLSEDPFAKLIGCPLNGEWNLVIKDQFPYDNGWIFAWGINFKNTLYPGLESFTPSITEHNWVQNPYITTAYTGDDMTVKPIHAGAANITYTIKDSYNCTFDTSINIKVLPPTSLLCASCNIDTFFNTMNDTLICINNTGVNLNKTPKKSPNSSIPFDGFPNAIIDAITNPILSPFVSKVPVSAIAPTTITNPLTQIDSVCFEIGTFAASDLLIELQSPTGQKIQLFNHPTAILGTPLRNVCFSPKGTRNINITPPPYTGLYQLQAGATAWNALNGSTIAGDWELHVSDARGTDKDTIKRWSITFVNQNGFKYAWSPATNLSCTNCATPKATPSVTTTYTVVVTDSTGCTHTDDIKVNVIDSLAAPVASVQNTNFTFIIFEWLPVVGASGYEVSVNNGSWIPANGTLTHRVFNLTIGDVVNFRVRATTSAVCGVKIASLTQATRACVASVGNGFNRRVEIDSILCHGNASPRVNFAYANGIAPLTYLIDSLTQPNLGIFIDKIRAGFHTATVIDSAGCKDSIKFYVYHPAPLSVKLAAFETKCNGEDNGKVTVVGGGGVGNFNYRITGSLIGEWRNTAVFDSLFAGKYEVELRDGNGCLFSDEIDVVSPPLFIVDLVKQDIRCFGEKSGVAKAIAKGGVQPYNWNWNTTKKTEEIDSLATGNYSVTVTDKNGCFFTSDVDIDENLEVILTASVDSVKCRDQASGRAQILATGGLSPYTYQWNNGYFGIDNANIKAGNYRVTVTDALGCLKTQSFDVFQPDSLKFDSLVSVKTFCPNDATGTATAYASGGTAPFTYTWNNAGQTTQRAINLKAGPYSITVKDAKGCLLDGDITVKANSAIVVDKLDLLTPLRCNGDHNAVLQALVSGGIGNYTYKWSTLPAQTTAAAKDLSAGKYTLTITDANNCSITKDTTISEPIKLDANITLFTNVKCKGDANGTATPSVSGGTPFPSGLKYQFKWSDAKNQVTAIASDLVAGNYILSVTDFNGCVDTATVSIKEPALALTTKIQQTKLACFNQNNGEATAISTGGLGSYIYQWNNLQRTQVAINLLQQKYFVTVSDINGCQAIDSLDVKTYDSIQVSFTPTNPSCYNLKNGSVAVSKILGGGGTGVLSTYTYRWNTLPVQITPSINNLVGNKYYEVTVIDNKGCETIASQNLTNPNPISFYATAKDVSCFGARNGEAKIEATGDNPPFAFLWDASANAQSTQTALNLASGRYKVTITDKANCSVDTTITITQPAGMKIASQQITDTKCADETTGKVSIKVEGGKPNYNYVWSNGAASTPFIEKLKSGRYDVIVTDANGCQLQETFNVKTPNVLDGDVSVNNAKCFGDNNGVVTIEGFGGTQPYLYSLGGTLYNGINQIVGVKAGKYDVFVKDANGCKWFDQVEVKQPNKFSIQAIQDISINLGDSILLSADAKNSQGGVQISWIAPYDKTLSCVKCPNPLSKPMYTITYAVSAIDSAGCRASDSVKVTVVKPRFVLVPTAFTPNQDNVNDILAVRGKDGTKINVFRVYDRWGELLYESLNFKINDPNSGWDGSFRGQPMTSGLYVWYIEAEYIDGAKEILKGHTSIIR